MALPDGTGLSPASIQGIVARSAAASARFQPVDTAFMVSATNTSISLTGNLTVSGSTDATPVVITTSTSHGYSTGNSVWISGLLVTGGVNSNANGSWDITVLSATTFSLTGSTGTGGTQIRNGTVRKMAASTAWPFSNASTTEILSQFTWAPYFSISAVRFAFTNMGQNPHNVLRNGYAAEADYLTTITVSAGIFVYDAARVTSGLTGVRFIRFTFNGGATTATIPPGGLVYTDPIAMPFTAGTRYVAQSRATFATTGFHTANTRPFSSHAGFTSTDGTALTERTTFTDSVLGSTAGPLGVPLSANSAITGLNSTQWYAPAMIEGVPADTVVKPVAMVRGDSISDGNSADNAIQYVAPGLGSLKYPGYLARGLKALNIPLVRMGCISNRASFELAGSPDFVGRQTYAVDKITHSIIEYGVNDIVQGVTAANLITIITNIAAEEKALGRRVAVCTLMPITDDASPPQWWTNLASQTLRAQEAERLTYNAWVRNTALTVQVGGRNVIDFIVDGAQYIEDSSTNKFLSGGIVATKTVTGTGSTTTAPVSGETAEYKLYAIEWTKLNGSTTIAATDQYRNISSSTTGGSYVMSAALSTAPIADDTFAIHDVYTTDGVHLNLRGAIVASQGIADKAADFAVLPVV